MSIESLEKEEREKILLYLTRYDRFVSPARNWATVCKNISADFAKLTCRSAFALNGGAVIALPTIKEVFKISKIDQHDMFISIILFILGLVLSSFSTYSYYIAYSLLERNFNEVAHAKVNELQGNNNIAMESSSKANELEKSAKNWDHFAKLAIFFSIVLFILGVFLPVGVVYYRS